MGQLHLLRLLDRLGEGAQQLWLAILGEVHPQKVKQRDALQWSQQAGSYQWGTYNPSN